ncbi:MAG TPA: O-antigen ligase family protein [Pyrinomonadaceae bacterium]|nr:O-antigen ligase family protein [Pyrinomonadaceae bacterium]
MQISNGLSKGVIACVFLIALFAPHSIAATQSAWLLGIALWALGFAFYPRPKLFRTPVDYVLLGFFILSGVSAVFSYSPIVSIGKMRAASLFTIVYLVAQNVPSLRVVRTLALTLIASCMVNVVWTAGQLALGRGVKIEGIMAESPLAQAVFRTRTVTTPTPIKPGDIVWEVDGRRVDTPDELAAALASGSAEAKVRIYRVEWTPELFVPRKLLPGSTAMEQLGITGWSSGRDWRATGFFGHWTTYAEVLQLIASLALGLFIAWRPKFSRMGLLLLIALAGLVFALAMTVTRGSWIGFAVSVAVMLLLSASRRTMLIGLACAIPLVLAGVFLLQQQRRVGFVDRADQSTSWREMVWREGFDLLVSKPRHLLVGVGMDSIKAHWREWHMFDNGRQPVGHMHSNLLQIALERGVPALIFWLLLFVIYIRMLWRVVQDSQSAIGNRQSAMDFSRGLALGALGGAVGFFTSGLVHYNWGDSEVVTVFYLIMGLVLAAQGRDQQTGSG